MPIMTIHGRILSHVKRSKQDGTAYTVNDHLTKDGVNNRPDFLSLRAQVMRLLREGAQYHEHLGPVYLLSVHTRGRLPEGYGEDPPTGEDQEAPDYETGSAVAPIADILVRGRSDDPRTRFGMPDTHYQVKGLLDATSRLTSRRTITAIKDGIVAEDTERRFEKAEQDSLAKENALLRQQNADLREQNSLLMRLVPAAVGGNGVVPSSRRSLPQS